MSLRNWILTIHNVTMVGGLKRIMTPRLAVGDGMARFMVAMWTTFQVGMQHTASSQVGRR